MVTITQIRNGEDPRKLRVSYLKKGKGQSHGAVQLIKQLGVVARKHNRYHSRRDKEVGSKTQTNRYNNIRRGLILLHDVLGYKIKDIDNLNQKHLRALTKHWEDAYWEQRLIADTIAGYYSDWHTFIKIWLGKPGLMLPKEELFSKPEVYKRKGAPTEEKTWTSAEVKLEDIAIKLFRLQPHHAISLGLCQCFGLRLKESLCFQPYQADCGDYALVDWGTKNGRTRKVEIKYAAQRDFLDLSKLFACPESQSLIPREFSYKKWRRKFYYNLELVGVTLKNLGITAHGLRHEFANELYEFETGMKSPLREMRERANQSVHTKVLDRHGRKRVSEALGHSRPEISDKYIGEQVGRLHHPKDGRKYEVIEVRP